MGWGGWGLQFHPLPSVIGYPRGLLSLWERSSQPSQERIDTKLGPQGEAEVSPTAHPEPLPLKIRMELGVNPCWSCAPWALSGSISEAEQSPAFGGEEGCVDAVQAGRCREGDGSSVLSSEGRVLLNEHPHWQ